MNRQSAQRDKSLPALIGKEPNKITQIKKIRGKSKGKASSREDEEIENKGNGGSHLEMLKDRGMIEKIAIGIAIAIGIPS